MAESMATMPSTSAFSSNLITAEIRVENLTASSSVESSTSATISIPTSSSVMPQQQQSIVENTEADNNNMPTISKKDFDEPETKRQKMDTSIKVKKLEKLESRLGSVLCCAVCLDLPKTAMYQVSRNPCNNINISFHLRILLFCSKIHFLIMFIYKTKKHFTSML